MAAGTRPELLKLTPVANELHRAGASVQLIRTGQHSDPLMTQVGVGLEGSRPTSRDIHWHLEGDSAARNSELLELAVREFSAEASDVVVVQGDTTSAAVVGWAARHAGIPVAHVEAGLRSGNERSLEELHRKMLASIASIHLAPTATAAANLTAEGVELSRIHVVGNPITDVLAASGITPIEVSKRHGVLLTAHRATNVDDPARLASVVDVACALAERSNVTFPVHPRTGAALDRHEMRSRLADAGVAMTDPLDHPSLLRVLSVSQLVVTDSGGLQEEASWFGVPAIVLRSSTPRPEGIEIGQAALAGIDPGVVAGLAEHFMKPSEQGRVAGLACPYGDGKSGPRIAAALIDRYERNELALTEPTLKIEAYQ